MIRTELPAIKSKSIHWDQVYGKYANQGTTFDAEMSSLARAGWKLSGPGAKEIEKKVAEEAERKRFVIRRPGKK